MGSKIKQKVTASSQLIKCSPFFIFFFLTDGRFCTEVNSECVTVIMVLVITLQEFSFLKYKPKLKQIELKIFVKVEPTAHIFKQKLLSFF